MNYVDDIVYNDYEKLTNKNYEFKKELKVRIIENGYILPVKKYYNPYKSLCGTGGILNEKMEYVEESAMLGYNMQNRLYGGYKINNIVEYINEEVIYINHFIHQWGHFLIDVINRLWYILDKDIGNLKFAYIVRENDNDEITGNYLELLNLLGIKKENLIRINRPTRVKKIIIPEASIYPGKYYTQGYKLIFDKIVENINIDENEKNKRKIYCSRKNYKKAFTKEIGEEKIERIFNDNGFDSVYFEQLSVIEQIKLINASKVIVAVSGTLPHNLVFARNNPHVIILNKTYKLNLHQFLINQLSNINVDFVDINVSPMPVEYGIGPFIIKITDHLLKFCEDNKYICNYQSNIKLSIKEKFWFYINYFVKNKFKIVKDKNISFKEIRNYYKKRSL